jgi:hypothetical protein
MFHGLLGHIGQHAPPKVTIAIFEKNSDPAEHIGLAQPDQERATGTSHNNSQTEEIFDALATLGWTCSAIPRPAGYRPPLPLAAAMFDRGEFRRPDLAPR